MKINRFVVVCFVSLFLGCKSQDRVVNAQMQPLEFSEKSDYTIAFGSCNKQYETNLLWDDILINNPAVWIWGGDNVYADTRNMEKLKRDYDTQLNNAGYKDLMATTKILGTWDDHDYGINDGGAEFDKKQDSQQLFLDFLGVSKDDSRRTQEGVYHSEILDTEKGSIKVIVLDTRYFRTALSDDNETKKRYKPHTDTNGTVLGEKQWEWFENELNNSKADFNLIVGSIQFFSAEHGFETWGNFPHEVEKLKRVIVDSNAKGVLLLSGDRHISEFSKVDIEGLDYPLIDFTSSGLTHVYSSYSGEPNKTRVGEVVSELSFGLLHFDFEAQTIKMQMRGDNNKKQQELIQQY
jgi:alkaline phosphatase D